MYAAGLAAATHHFLSVLIEFWWLIGLDQMRPGVLAASSCGANANASGTHLQRGTAGSIPSQRVMNKIQPTTGYCNDVETRQNITDAY